MAEEQQQGRATESKPKAAKRPAEAVATFEVVAEHDPDNANGPAEGTVHLRSVNVPDARGAQLVFPAGTTIVHRGRAKVGQRFAVRLPLERVAAAADDDDGDE